MVTKQRVTILACGAALCVLAWFFVDVSVYEGERTCAYCETREEFREVSCFVFGASWQRTTLGSRTLGMFLIDFPEHHCDHLWARHHGKRKWLWQGTWVRRVSDPGDILTSRSAIVERYSEDPAFRRQLRQLLVDGVISEARLLELARANCMDGGTCKMRTGNP
ncbi:MAG: hypothetical protein MUF04_09305, partial [Akkermansiaceae bacterium]|nr:hypothetical protein [Akkermansiaceae bacterium]